MSEYQLDFIRRYQSLFYTYRNFPLPVVICNRHWKVHFSNDLANQYYENATTSDGLAKLLGEYDRDALLKEAVETGNCTLKEVQPLASVNLSITPILENHEPAGLILMFVRMDNYIDSKTYYQGNRMPGVLADGIRETVGDVLSALDDAYSKAELMGTAWMQESFNRMTLSGYRMLRLASNLTEYARYQSGLLDLRLEDKNLSAYLAGMEPAACSIAEPMGVPLKFRLPVQELYTQVDTARFEAAFFNLLHNALFYTRPGNEVEVELAFAPNQTDVVVQISDRGLGIPPEVLADVTRPYFSYGQVPGANGTGLGLSIAWLMAQAHGGNLQIVPREGTGTIVTLTLPADHSASSLLLEQESFTRFVSDRFSPAYIGLMSAALSPYCTPKQD